MQRATRVQRAFLLKGPKATRLVAKEFKEEIVRLGTEGVTFQSGHHVLEVMKKLKLTDKQLQALNTANRWHSETMARYDCGLRQSFTSTIGRVISVAWDATRLSQKEYLFAVMWANHIAAMMPPIAPSSINI